MPAAEPTPIPRRRGRPRMERPALPYEEAMQLLENQRAQAAARARKYYERHREQCIAARKAYYHANAQKTRERMNEYRHEKRDTIAMLKKLIEDVALGDPTPGEARTAATMAEALSRKCSLQQLLKTLYHAKLQEHEVPLAEPAAE